MKPTHTSREAEPAKPRPGLNKTHKKFILLAASLAFFGLLACIPFYRNWVNFCFGDIPNWEYQLTHNSLEERKVWRYGYSYAFFKDISIAMQQNKISDAVVLLPPNELVRKIAKQEFEVVEPLVLYYLTGIRSVTVNSENVNSATCALVPVAGPQPVQLLRVNPRQLSYLIDTFKKAIPHP